MKHVMVVALIVTSHDHCRLVDIITDVSIDLSHLFLKCDEENERDELCSLSTELQLHALNNCNRKKSVLVEQ